MKSYNFGLNVYDATQERLKYLFDEFENVLIAFSGGKDSGVALNLAYDYARENDLLHKLAMYHLDYEAQYEETTKYVERTFEKYDGIRKYWLCLPMAAQCAVSMQQDHWVPWDKDQKAIWAREMPESAHVVHEDNVMFDFSRAMWDYDVQKNFGRWFAGENGTTAIVIGIRTDESLSRMGAISSSKKVNTYDGKSWINADPLTPTMVNAYPLYDWHVEDIWIANGKHGWDYNRLYDLFWQAGLTLDQMRVASPFNDAAIESLKIYKVVDPSTWAKLIGRVNGVNFAGLYGGTTAMGWRSITLPKGHTWKSYLEFLLSTLPEVARKNYEAKFETSIKFWATKGGVLSQETIDELTEEGKSFEVGDATNYKTDKLPVTFQDYPDETNAKDFKSVPSYKRMCICIMKNDHLCKYMGFSQTKKETEQRKRIINRYENIIYGRPGGE